MKERILVPDRLRPRLERLVRARMAAAQEDEGLARLTVERSVLQAGMLGLCVSSAGRRINDAIDRNTKACTKVEP